MMIPYVWQMTAAEGVAWPYEQALTYDAFVSYFFTTSSTTVIGVVHPSRPASPPLTLKDAIGGRPLTEVVGGSFYIKPNYPGRSSHVGDQLALPFRGRAHHVRTAYVDDRSKLCPNYHDRMPASSCLAR